MAKHAEWLNIGTGRTYFHRVHRPLQCLIFILPLLLFYQIGSTIRPWDTSQHAPPQVIAFVLMLRFFALFGVAGNFLPLLAVVAILLAWHVARRDPWEFDPGLYTGMAIESILWALPVLVIGFAVFRKMAAMAYLARYAGNSGLAWQTEAVLSVGAGVYEELLFRLIAITIMNILLVDVFEMSLGAAIPIIIIGTSILFSAYHYMGEAFNWHTFFFRTAAGIFFAGIFIFRGFGITVGCHAVYDLMLVALQH